jgi:class 3 adenylate cyclase/tetratricopeptide (TPR) repeat protein
MADRDRVLEAIAAQEALRGDVPDEVIDIAVAALRAQLDGDPTPKVADRRRQATVLFADVAGFTAMSEDVDAEVLAGLMNELWAALDAQIRGHGGRVDKHIGDAVMGVWGAESAREDDPERAVLAALSICSEFEAFRSTHDIGIDIRVGINTGRVVFGEVGTTGELSVTGDAVNVASRIEGSAPAGGVAISHDTYRHVRGVFDVQPRDPIEVKGKSRPIRTYVVERAKPRAFRVPSRGVEGVETPMVGREAELRGLQQAYLDATEHSCARLVSVIGEAGAGKSRLLHEFTEWLDLRPESIYHFKGRAVPDSRLAPRSLLREMFASRLEVFDDDGPDVVAQKLRSGLTPLTEREADIAGHWLGFDLGHSRAVRDLAGSPEFGTIAQSHLTHHLQSLLVDSPAVIEHILHRLADTPLTVVSVARPTLNEHRPEWASGPGAPVRVELDALADADGRALVLAILQLADEVPEQLVDLVVDRAGGNPFHAEELVKMLIDDGVIRVEDERWHIESARLDRLSVPATLTGVMQARLDGLDPPELATLQHASVIGRTFWDDAVAELLDGAASTTAIRSSLQTVGARDFIRHHPRSTFGGCQEYAFNHALLRDAAYETVLLRDRPRLHRIAAHWLERRSGERLGEHVGLLAEHLSRAGQLERAADLLHDAGRRARTSGALRAAVGYYERSLELRAQVEDEPGTAATATRIRLGDALSQLARYDDASTLFEDAARDAERLDDEQLVADAWANALRSALQRGDFDGAASLVERVRPIAERRGGEPLARFLDGAARLLAFGPEQDIDEALRVAARSLEVWRRLEDPVNELLALNTMVMVSNAAGNLQETERWLDEGLALARRLGDTSSEETLLMNQAVVSHQQARAGRGSYERTLELYRSSIERSNRLGLSETIGRVNLAQAEVEAGRLEDGAMHARSALRTGWRNKDELVTELCLVTLGQLAIAEGRIDEGVEILAILLAHRRTPSLVDEVTAALDFHGVESTTVDRVLETAPASALDALVRRLLDDDQTGTASR